MFGNEDGHLFFSVPLKKIIVDLTEYSVYNVSSIDIGACYNEVLKKIFILKPTGSTVAQSRCWKQEKPIARQNSQMVKKPGIEIFKSKFPDGIVFILVNHHEWL